MAAHKLRAGESLDHFRRGERVRDLLAAAVATGAAFAVLGAAWLARVVAKPIAAATADAGPRRGERGAGRDG